MDHRNIHIPFGPTDSELAVIQCLRQTEGLGDFIGHTIDMILTLPSIPYLLLTIIFLSFSIHSGKSTIRNLLHRKGRSPWAASLLLDQIFFISSSIRERTFSS